jgi:hypothetical protein
VGASASSAADTMAMVEFAVADTGIGVPAGKKGQLFQPFAQTQRLAGGTGLGLYSLAKRVEVRVRHVTSRRSESARPLNYRALHPLCHLPGFVGTPHRRSVGSVACATATMGRKGVCFGSSSPTGRTRKAPTPWWRRRQGCR